MGPDTARVDGPPDLGSLFPQQVLGAAGVRGHGRCVLGESEFGEFHRLVEESNELDIGHIRADHLHLHDGVGVVALDPDLIAAVWHLVKYKSARRGIGGVRFLHHRAVEAAQAQGHAREELVGCGEPQLTGDDRVRFSGRLQHLEINQAGWIVGGNPQDAALAALSLSTWR